jgi:hypothetical protein
MLIDGTKLSPADVKRPGYVTESSLSKRRSSALHFWGYALAFKLTRDPLMWSMTRSIGTGLGLGQFGEPPGQPGEINLHTDNAESDLIFALLDLHQATGRKEFLTLAARIGDNALAREFHHGFFVPDERHVMAQLDSSTPLALLYLHAALHQPTVELPVYSASRGYLHGYYAGQGRTYDTSVIYPRLRQ